MRRRRALGGLAAAAAAALTPADSTARVRRVISVGGGVTEIVYALGAEGELVATDTTSVYPSAAATTPKVGYQRALSAEGLLSLAPTVLLASHDAGPASALAAIERAGVELVRADERSDFDGLLARVERIAAVLQRRAAGAVLTARLRDQWRDSRAAVRQRRAARPPRVVFVLAHAGAPVVAGSQTSADALIALAGGVNPLAASFPGYRPMTPESLVEAAPHVLLTTVQGLQAQGGEDGLLARPGVALTPAGRVGRVVALDALYLLGFGPRLPAVVRELAARFDGEGGR